MTDIRPFRIDIPDAALQDLRARLAPPGFPRRRRPTTGRRACRSRTCRRSATTGRDEVRLAARRGAAQRVPAVPTTESTALDIHFLHVRSPHDGRAAARLTHGWPGSVVEFLKVIGPLTDPTAHGGAPADAFHVVCPSLPGYGFSRQADRAPAGASSGSPTRGRADGAARLRPLRRAGRRLGLGRHDGDRRATTPRTASAST